MTISTDLRQTADAVDALYGELEESLDNVQGLLANRLELLAEIERLRHPDPPPPPPPPPPPTSTRPFLWGVKATDDPGWDQGYVNLVNAQRAALKPPQPPLLIDMAQRSVDDYARNFGPVDVAHQFATANMIGSGQAQFNGWWVNCIARWAQWLDAHPGTTLMLTIAPGFAVDYIDGPDPGNECDVDRAAFESVARGDTDELLRNLQRLFVQFNVDTRRVILRVWHESAQFFYTHQASIPDLFITGFRRIVTVLRNAGFKGEFGWDYGGPTTSSAGIPLTPIGNAERTYPGDDYVQWIMFDPYFDRFNLPAMKRWLDELTAFNVAHHKKVGLGEFGLWGPEQITDDEGVVAFNWLWDRVDAGHIDMLCAFNIDVPGPANHVLSWAPRSAELQKRRLGQAKARRP